MHESSMKNMKAFIKEHLKGTGVVLDVGSLDICGSYRQLFDGWNYIGADIGGGNNVDLVLTGPYLWWTFSNECIDVVISGQFFEHIEFPEMTMAEIARVLKIGGLCCIISPSGGDPEYGLRKFKVKDFEKLATDAGLKVLSCHIDRNPEWKDCVLIAKKERSVKSEDQFGLRPQEN